ncbi:MAG: HEAT repeat domain-containing protein [Melioribacteraceae bacterium]|nr:HEAT repeat domain-containing protein [Melioribacteraceae bacterium]
MMFDQCFNGAFHVENYITGRYLFGSGNVISAIAGSIGVLQDLWANKSLGLLGYGMSVGHWFDQNNYLEHHIYGDPTFHFKKTYEVDLNKKIREEKDNADYWNNLLTAPEPEIRALAIVQLYKLLGEEFIPKLIDIYNNDYSFNVRLHVFSILAGTRSDEFNELLFTSINDPFEYIRRMSGKLMGEIGDDKYIPVMIHALIHDESSRIGFSTGRALGQMDNDKVEIEAEKYIADLPDFVDKEKLNTKFERTDQTTIVDYYMKKLYRLLMMILSS